jgi:biofilm PGA synthesis N-glycosyltransferase PgaC
MPAGDGRSSSDYAYLCKLDLDLDLPRVFRGLIARMEADPRLGTCSGKPYMRRGGNLVSERRGDEMSAGMTKFYRRACFEDIGGFVREVMWDAIDCHKARQEGLARQSLGRPGAAPSSICARWARASRTIWSGAGGTGRAVVHGLRPALLPRHLRLPHGRAALCAGRACDGCRAMSGHGCGGERQLDDPELVRFIRAYQRRALRVGKARAVAEIEGNRRKSGNMT